MDRLISKLQVLWKAEDNLNWRMEDLGVQGYKRVLLVMSELDSDGR